MDGRALPSEVAHGARAVVRGAILAFIDQPDVTRIRVQWDCDGKNLRIDIRDDGTSGLATESEQVQPLRQRVAALNGSLNISTTEGWGSEMSVVLPLDPPATQDDGFALWGLGPRELDVLERIAAGMRNKEIAADLGISENTVKFHASKIFSKLGITSRPQVASMVPQRRSTAGDRAGRVQSVTDRGPIAWKLASASEGVRRLMCDSPPAIWVRAPPRRRPALGLQSRDHQG